MFLMIVCLVFVFTSLIEYAVVNVIARRPAVGGGPASASAAAGDDDRQPSASIRHPDGTADGSVTARSRWKRATRSAAAASDDTPLQQALITTITV